MATLLSRSQALTPRLFELAANGSTFQGRSWSPDAVKEALRSCGSFGLLLADPQQLAAVPQLGPLPPNVQYSQLVSMLGFPSVYLRPLFLHRNHTRLCPAVCMLPRS